MNQSEMRSRLRIDLHDEDSANYRWTDNQLDRHMGRAVRELSAARPRPDVATIQTGSAGRTVSLASLADLIRVEAVEFPADESPPSYVDFGLRGPDLTLLVEEGPGAGESVKVFYGRLHTLNDATSTIPAHLEELVLAGAAGYAAMDWSGHAINSINLGGPQTWRHFLVWGQEKLAYFRQGLANLSRRTSLRVRRLYRPLYQPTGGIIGGGY